MHSTGIVIVPSTAFASFRPPWPVADIAVLHVLLSNIVPSGFKSCMPLFEFDIPMNVIDPSSLQTKKESAFSNDSDS